MFAAQAYLAVQAASSSPWQLIDQLYRTALQRIDEGRLDKAYAIVSEGLFASLNPAVPFSRGLADTYEIVLRHLEPAGDPGTARRMLQLLHEAWQAIEPSKVSAAHA